jgi:hypothetical protein
MNMHLRRCVIALAAAGAVVAGSSRPMAAGPDSRLKDIATLQGASPLPMVGYGLVVGLNKTGDKRQTIFSAQTLANMLERFGIAVSPGEIKIENVAAVLVTAQLGPYAQPGAHLDVTVSSIGDARSLQGGTLVPTPLRGLDGSVVALAQGQLSLAGFGADGGGGNSVQVNHLTVGRVPGGALEFRNRGSMGSGHGWSMGWGVMWNCEAKEVLVQDPPGAVNWVIGCTGELKRAARPFAKEPELGGGTVDSHRTKVAPGSLYLRQLEERLGAEAVKNIGY